jgi:hypothetical protein
MSTSTQQKTTSIRLGCLSFGVVASTLWSCQSKLTVQTTQGRGGQICGKATSEKICDPATSLKWRNTSPTSSSTLVASWTKSASSKLDNQQIRFYSDATCKTATSDAIDLQSKSQESYSFTATTAGTYYFLVSSVGIKKDTIDSSCSEALVYAATASTVDTVSPIVSNNSSSPSASSTHIYPARFLSAKTAENNQVSLAWAAPAYGPAVTSYKIYRSTTSPVAINDSNLISTAASAATSYVDSTAVNATKYYYAIVVTTANGNADPSIEADATPWDHSAAVNTSNVFLDFSAGVDGTGSYASPYNALSSAYTGVADGGTINIFDSTWSSGTTVVIRKSVTIRSFTGDYRNSAVIFNGRGITIGNLAEKLNATVNVKGIEFSSWADNIFSNGNRTVKNFNFIGNYVHDGTSYGMFAMLTPAPAFDVTWGIHNNTFDPLSTAARSAIIIKYQGAGASISITNNSIANIGWNGIQINDTSGLTISYNTISNTGDAAIQFDNASGNSTVSYNDISDANVLSDVLQGGLTFYNAALINASFNIHHNTFDKCYNGMSFRDVNFTTGAYLTIENNTFKNNNGKGIYKGGTGAVTATNNYWGAVSGPTDSSNPGGSGDAVSSGVTYSPFRTAP